MTTQSTGSSDFLNNLGRAYFMAGNYKAAIEWCDKALQVEPTLDAAHLVLAMAYALDGNEAKARAEAAEVRRRNPQYRFDVEAERARSASPAFRAYLEERVIPGLGLVSVPSRSKKMVCILAPSGVDESASC